VHLLVNRLNSKNNRMQGNCSGIQERRGGFGSVEHELRRSEAYLSEAQRLSQTGSFGWDVSSGEIYWSEQTFRIFELDPKTKITIDLIVKRTHPDDRAAVQQAIECASRERTEFALDHRRLMPDGSIKYLQVVGRPFTDEGRRSEFVGAVTDITNHRRAEESLRKSEAYLAEAQRLSNTGSFGCKFSSGEMFWSEETFEIFGYNRATLPAVEAILQRVHPEDKATVQEHMHRAASEGKSCDLEYRLLMPDDSVKHIHVVAHAAKHEPGGFEFVGAVTDVTDRKRAEEELQANEQKYRYLVDTTPAFVHTALPNGDLDFFNRGWLEFFGVPLTDLVGWRWISKIHPEDVDAIVSKWCASIESGKRFVHESRVRQADGEYRWFLHRKEPLHNEAGEIVKWYGSSIEIEERKIAEEKLRRSEAHLLDAQQLSRTGSWTHDFSSGRVTISPETFRIWGIRPEDDASVTEFFFGRIHPDDRHMVEEAYEQARLRKAEFASDFRIILPEGTIKYIHSIGHPILNESSEVVEFVGAAVDVTEQRRARAELERALEEIKRLKDRLQVENIALREEIINTSMFEEIVGNSPPLQQVLVRVAKVAPTDSTVLITGETGTGKELIARAIHKASKRSDRAFVSVNCAAIPQSLIPSELFGHEKGAFTGATGRRLGRFELAEGGTIFLDEVGELPPETQVALLRVLQEHEFERVGGNRPIRANVRVIVATNRDLEAAIAAGKFRSDLFYRLNVFPIEIPPLRQRREDLPMLVQYFIDRYARELGKNIGSVSKETLDLFQSYAWPGNIRELRNVIERSIIVCETETFSVDESWLSRKPLPAQPTGELELRQRLAGQEREAIEAALTESRGRVFGPAGAAARLGIARSTLESKISTLKIDKNRFKISKSIPKF
jgi:PAS domain S-box-containing protein